MAPTIISRVPSGEQIQHLSRYISSAVSRLATRNVASTTTPLASIFALVLTSSSSVSRRALTSLADLPSSSSSSQLTTRSTINPLTDTPTLLKRQNAILAIPATYDGLNAGPAPGAVVGITLGSVFGFIFILYLLLLSFQLYGGGGETVVKEEIVVKRRSQSKAKSHRSSHHSVHNSPPPAAPPPRRSSHRETIVEIEEEIIRHSSRRPSPSPSPDQVIVEEEESHSDEIVEVIEEGSSYTSVGESTASPPPRQSNSGGRRSGYRIVDPAEVGGGDAPMRRMSRRSSGHG